MVRFVAAWLLFIGSAVAQERVDLQSRPGVTEPVYITAVANSWPFMRKSPSPLTEITVRSG